VKGLDQQEEGRPPLWWWRHPQTKSTAATSSARRATTTTKTTTKNKNPQGEPKVEAPEMRTGKTTSTPGTTTTGWRFSSGEQQVGAGPGWAVFPASFFFPNGSEVEGTAGGRRRIPDWLRATKPPSPNKVVIRVNAAFDAMQCPIFCTIFRLTFFFLGDYFWINLFLGRKHFNFRIL
jgi:hypothetical protein